jgi:hypothetical protein
MVLVLTAVVPVAAVEMGDDRGGIEGADRPNTWAAAPPSSSVNVMLICRSCTLSRSRRRRHSLGPGSVRGVCPVRHGAAHDVRCALWRATSLRPRRRRPCTTAPSCSTSAWPTRTDDTRPTRPGPRRGSAQCHDGTTRPTSMGRFMRADGGGDDAALSRMKASGGPGT